MQRIKTILFFTCMLSLLVTSNAQKKITRYFSSDSSLIYQQYFVDEEGKINGEFIEYYINQNIAKKGPYLDSKPNGEWQFFYENGSLKSEGNFANGKNSGVWNYYFENGNKRMVGELRNDKKIGLWEFYYENNTIKKEGEFKDGKKSGHWKYYHEDGKFKAEADFVNDEGIYIEYYEDGTVKMKGKIRNNKSFGIWKYYYPNGFLKAVGREENGVKDGKWEFYYETGELKSTGMYENGKSIGDWKYYYKNGQLEATGKQAIEEKQGYWNMFYPNGKLKTEADYSDDNSSYKEYFQSGKLKVKGQFKNSKHDGLWIYYYEDGTREGVCNYQNGKGLYKGFYKNGNLKMEGYLLNGEKIGNWKLYNKEGKVVGYYKSFEKETYPNFEKKFEALDDTLFQEDKAKHSLAKKQTRKKKKRIQYPGINKPHPHIIVATNPVSPLFGGLPVSIEYYSPKYLSHQINFFYLKSPFFTPERNIPVQKIYSDGFSIDYRLKKYQKERVGGMPFFGQEFRFKVLSNNLKIRDTISTVRALQQRETNYEYTALFGSRQFYKKISKRLTTEFYLGLGIGYQTISKNWGSNPEYDELFGNTKTKSFNWRYRLGFNVGYKF